MCYKSAFLLSLRTSIPYVINDKDERAYAIVPNLFPSIRDPPTKQRRNMFKNLFFIIMNASILIYILYLLIVLNNQSLKLLIIVNSYRDH